MDNPETQVNALGTKHRT